MNESKRARSAHAAGDPGVGHGARDSALAARAAVVLVALATVGLGAYALFLRPVGDYLTESDFYAGYAPGARALLQGSLDFSRYGVYGPFYELMLAAAGTVVPGLFTAARLLSVLSAAVVLLAWWRIAARRLGDVTGFGLVALLVTNPTCMRYAYSVGTDMVSMALFSASAWASLGMRSRAAPFVAGLMGGLAALTRYNLASVLPAAMLLEAARTSAAPARRARAALLVLAGFLLPVLPWTLASLGAGQLPAGTLMRDRGFYLDKDGESAESRYGDLGAGAAARASRGPGPLAIAPRLAVQTARGVAGHLGLDARDLVGLPYALLALAGLAFALVRREVRRFAPFVPHLAFTFLVLAPVFYTERYSMVLAPIYLLPGAWLVARIAAAPWRRPLPALAAAALAVSALVPTLAWAFSYHRACLEILPFEARAAGEALRSIAPPGGRVLARKAHVAFYAGLEPVAFASVPGLPALGAYCRERSVDWLYFSWYEARVRPAFAFLLDTSAAVPGLTVVHETRYPASVTYRIGPRFGELPDWWEDEAVRRRVAARVNALLARGTDAGPFLAQLADDALSRGDPTQALADAEEALRADPRRDEARVLAAEAQRLLGRPGEAAVLLRDVLARRPDALEVRLQLGRALRESGRDAEAADTWRPVVSLTRDAAMLREMERLYAARGDTVDATTARRTLERVNR